MTACLHSELTRLSATLWECAERDCMFAIRLPQPATSTDREVPGSQAEPGANPGGRTADQLNHEVYSAVLRGQCQLANMPACEGYPNCECGRQMNPVRQGAL